MKTAKVYLTINNKIQMIYLEMIILTVQIYLKINSKIILKTKVLIIFFLKYLINKINKKLLMKTIFYKTMILRLLRETKKFRIFQIMILQINQYLNDKMILKIFLHKSINKQVIYLTNKVMPCFRNKIHKTCQTHNKNLTCRNNHRYLIKIWKKIRIAQIII